MNDAHDNSADDKAMLERIRELGRAAWDQHHGKSNAIKETTLNRVNPKTGRLFTRADLDTWSQLDTWALEAGLFEPSDQQVIDWNEANDYRDDGPGPGE